MQPKPPDAGELADAQTEINRDTAQTQFQYGATNQITPWGSLTYQQVGTWPDGTPRYEARQTMSPQVQGLYDALLGASRGAASNIGQQINLPNTSGLSPLPTSGDYSADRLRVEESLWNRLNPQMDRSRASREQDLFNRGVRPGTEAYDNAMRDLAQQENDLRNQVVLSGGQEQSRMFADALAGRSQEFNELGSLFNMGLAARSQPINEIAALMGGTGISSPGYVPTPQPGVSGVDYAGLRMQQYQDEAQRYQNMMSGLFNLGGSIIGGMFGLSDVRAKEDIELVGETNEGTPIYTYRYKGDPETRMGVMAQELMKKQPDAVAMRPDGYLGVDYAKVA